jgi:hypothetical protein
LTDPAFHLRCVSDFTQRAPVFLQKDGGSKRIEADRALHQGLARHPDFILSYNPQAMARSAQSRSGGRSFSVSALA